MSVDFNTADVCKIKVFTEVKIHSVVYWVTELFSLADEYSPTRQQGILFVYDLFNVTVSLCNVKWWSN
jgi:hypothetical protein